MNYSDILLFTIDSTAELNQNLASIIKSESAMKVSNESALYYSLASETFTEKVKEYAAAAWKFIKELAKKIKGYIVTAYKKVRDFIAKKIAAIKAKFSKKEGGETKPEEAKPETKASEAADDFRYYVGTSSFDEFTKTENMLKEIEQMFSLQNLGPKLKSLSNDEIAEMKKEGDGDIAEGFKEGMQASINAMKVVKVSANNYSNVAAAYVANYNRVVDKMFKAIANISNAIDKFANSLNDNAEYTSEQVSFAKYVAATMGKVISKVTSLRTRATALDLSLVPATGFISEEAANSAFTEYKEKALAIAD